MMFKRSFPKSDRVNKIKKPSKRSFNDDAKEKLREQLKLAQSPSTIGSSSRPSREAIYFIIGKEQRRFQALEDALRKSPYLGDMCKKRSSQVSAPRHIWLLDEDPETFSAVLEYLHHGDYQPRLFQDTRTRMMVTEDNAEVASIKTEGGHSIVPSATIYVRAIDARILRDTAVYCAAIKFGLPELQALALEKQRSRSGFDVPTMIRSARYAYENTPSSEVALRAWYLSGIIKGRKAFMRSGTMRDEMEDGSSLFFDLFVAMCNRMDDLESVSAYMRSH